MLILASPAMPLVSVAVAWSCGEQDVYSLNLTDAYWSTFYMTPQRISNGVR